MNKTFTYDDVPTEVWEVWAAEQWSKAVGGVGRETYERCQEIVKKYPDWFPWEHKYDKISQFVHDAYRREAYPLELPMPKDDKEYIGLIPTLFSDVEVAERATQKPMTIVDVFASMFKEEQEKRKRKEAARIERKRIWDKHYSKYGLEYRGD